MADDLRVSGHLFREVIVGRLQSGIIDTIAAAFDRLRQRLVV